MENSQKKQMQYSQDEEPTINLKDMLYTLLSHWRWFVLSLFVCLAVAFLVSQSAVRYYSRTASIMLKDKKTGSSASDLLVSNNLLNINGSSAVENELQVLKSRTLMMQVVERLNLEVTYSQKSFLRKPACCTAENVSSGKNI